MALARKKSDVEQISSGPQQAAGKARARPKAAEELRDEIRALEEYAQVEMQTFGYSTETGARIERKRMPTREATEEAASEDLSRTTTLRVDRAFVEDLMKDDTPRGEVKRPIDGA